MFFKVGQPKTIQQYLAAIFNGEQISDTICRTIPAKFGLICFCDCRLEDSNIKTDAK
jgi:hypothetical protein